MEGHRPDAVPPTAVTDRAGHAATERTLPPWWTEADQAESEVLVRELVDGIWEHRPKCASCARSRTDGPCPHIRKAIEIVVEWHERRHLVSRAIWLRTAPELLAFKRDLAAFRRGEW